MSHEQLGEGTKLEQVQFIADPREVLDGVRTPPEKRKFVSSAVESQIQEMTGKMADRKLARIFENCFPHTLDTTINDSAESIRQAQDKGGFVTTGNIPAMWLRDSTNQMLPYLGLVNTDDKLKGLFKRVISKQAECVNRDPYANAFNKDPDDATRWDANDPARPGVYEQKWELDSLGNFLRLSLDYHEETGDTSIFDEDWQKAADSVLKTFRTEQRKRGWRVTPYEHNRKTTWPPDQILHEGKGALSLPLGFIYSAFRPSDDACKYPFLIPSNMLVAVQLDRLSGVYQDVLANPEKADKCKNLSKEIRTAIETHGKAYKPGFGEIYAYEVDGRGNQLFIDDANAPSLLSIPEFGYCDSNDEIYQNTRKFVLSKANPYYFEGEAAHGIGSFHTTNSVAKTEKIWPMSLIMQARTSNDPEEIKHCLEMLKNTDADKHYMHESFNKDDPKDFTRAWFAWANAQFALLILEIYQDPKKKNIL